MFQLVPYADSCDPRLKGCQPEGHTVLIAFIVFAAVLFLIALAVVLIVVLVHRHRRPGRMVPSMMAQQGSFGPPASPGWYQDPRGRYPWRYFDGRAWTNQVSSGSGDSTTDPYGS